MLNHLKSFAIGLLLSTAFCTAAWANEQLSKIENAFQAADTAALTTLAETAEGENELVARYRLASLALGNNQISKATTLLTEFKNSLEMETSTHPDNAEAWALLASTYGMLTTLEPDKTTEYGTNAGAAEARALATGPNNPMVLLLTGINKFYTPEQWGGGKTKALDYFDRAVTAYQAGEIQRTWGHADALVWRATTHATLGNQAQAQADINAALAMAPNYHWAKGVLSTL